MQQGLEENSKTFVEYWTILRRRRNLFAIAVVAILLVTVFYAQTLPPIYQSVATILIEDTDIPDDIAGSMVTNYVSQQIQLTSQRLLTASKIEDLVKKFNIYGSADSEVSIPPTALAAMFRQDIELGFVNTDIINSRGQLSQAAIAFTLAFNSVDPEISQKVTAELVSLLLNENERRGSLRATEIANFLRQEVADANEELLRTEVELAAFKARNEGALPELRLLNLNIFNRTEQQISDTNLRIQQLEQRKIQLSSQLAQLSPTAAVTLPTGETVMSDRERLRALRVDFRRKTAIYKPGHPDLVRLEREIEMLEKSVIDPEAHVFVQDQLRREKESLGALRERYMEDHPDVRSAVAAIARLESQIQELEELALTQGEVADNPAYVMIDMQLESTELEIENSVQKLGELQARVVEYESLIRQAPNVEMQYDGLLRENENAKTKYNDLRASLRTAEVAAGVEHEIVGRRFVLVESPALPLYPKGPNRIAIVIAGFILAVGVGIGCVVFAEFLDNSIRSATQLAYIVGSAPLAVIPYLDNSADISHTRARRIYLVAGALTGTALYFVYFLYWT